MGRMQHSRALGALVCLTLGCAAPRAPSPVEPDVERRDQPVDEIDLRILERASAILSTEARWNRADDRVCPPRAQAWSLFCALHDASLEVTGAYQHRRASLQEVRFVVEDETRGRELQHRLMDWNNLPETTFADVKRALAVATERVRARLASPR
jgi:hypothetical protein